MARQSARRPRDSGRFRIFEDERDGLEFGFIPITSYPNAYSRQTGKPVNDQGIKVVPSEFDQPPPHGRNETLGGEGDISGDRRTNSDFATASNVFIIPPESTKTILYVNSSTSISWNVFPTIYIVGSNVSQVMSVNPQVTAGDFNNHSIALECVGSSVTLINGSGLTFNFASTNLLLNSGGIATLIWNATDSTWHITSFSTYGGL